MYENPSYSVDSQKELSLLLGDTLDDSDESTARLKIQEFLRAFLREVPEGLMQLYLINEEQEKLICELQFIIDKNSYLNVGLQEIFQKILLRSILDLPEPNYLTAMCANMNIQDDFNFEEYAFMVPIFEAFSLTFSKELYNVLVKNVCDNYPKWLEDNEPTLSKDEFYKHALAFENVKEIRDYFENRKDTDVEIDKRIERVKLMNLLIDMSMCHIQIPDHLYYTKIKTNQSNDVLVLTRNMLSDSVETTDHIENLVFLHDFLELGREKLRIKLNHLFTCDINPLPNALNNSSVVENELSELSDDRFNNTDEPIEQLKTQELLREFISEFSEEAMKSYLNSDEKKEIIGVIQLFFKNSSDLNPGLQDIFKNILFEYTDILELADPNNANSTCAEIVDGYDLNFNKYVFNLPIFGKFSLPFAKELYDSLIKNVCDNYLKCLKDETNFSKDEMHTYVINYDQLYYEKLIVSTIKLLFKIPDMHLRFKIYIKSEIILKIN
ncbi:Pex19 protein [Cinara cedri]|uniref:Peroxin-19 n=1 Tax=Cinara cedri TaxID=506608 RepID=A0A5E4MQA8_9HEMI|nr:Pex19 protein [Cinara cedri]